MSVKVADRTEGKMQYIQTARELLKKNAAPKALDTLTATFVGYLKEFHYTDRYTYKLRSKG